MDPTGLLSLPVELIQYIGKHLSVNDVLSCSLACHFLRSALNDNSVWKRYQPENQDITKLAVEKQHVEPAYQPQQGLTPLCEYREHFMRRTHLLKNWRTGRFVQHNLTDLLSDTYVGIKNTTRGRGQLIYENRYMFLSAYYGGREVIEVWDIEKKPKLYKTLKLGPFEMFQIVGSNLMVFNFCKVIVYRISIPDKTFTHRFSILINQGSVIYKPIKSIKHLSACKGWTHTVHGYILISIKENQYSFHIWDISNSSKIGSFELPAILMTLLETAKLFTLTVEAVSGDNVLLGTQLDIHSYYYFAFNIAKKDFSEFELKIDGVVHHAMMYGSNVLMFTQANGVSDTMSYFESICTLYDFDTQVELKKRRFKNAERNFRLNKTKILNGTFVMLCYDCFEVVDVLTLDTVFTVPCTAIRFIHYHLDILGSFIAVVCTERLKMEVWDITGKKQLTGLLTEKSYDSHIKVNNLSTKLVCVDWVVGSIVVLNFW